MKRKNTKLTAIVITFIFLMVCFNILNAALWTNKDVKLESKPAASSQFSLKNLALNGGIDLNSEDINSLIQLYLPKLKTQNSMEIENIISEIKDNKIGFEVQGKYHGVNFMLTTRGSIGYDGSLIYYYPDYFKLGKLTLPKSIVLKSLSKLMPVNISKERLEFDKGILPVEIKSLEIKEDIVHIVVSKTNQLYPTQTPSTKDGSKGTAKTPTNKTTGSTSNTANSSLNNPKADLLKRASTQLKKVYSLAETSNEKKVVSLIQNTLNNMADNINYSYKSDASNVLNTYNKLSAAEKTNIKNTILNNMDFQTLSELKNTFGF